MSDTFDVYQHQHAYSEPDGPRHYLLAFVQHGAAEPSQPPEEAAFMEWCHLAPRWRLCRENTTLESLPSQEEKLRLDESDCRVVRPNQGAAAIIVANGVLYSHLQVQENKVVRVRAGNDEFEISAKFVSGEDT